VGRFDDATKTASRASRLLVHRDERLTNRIRQQLEHYAQRKRFYPAGAEAIGG
jgi:hypothetical protein